MRKTVKILHTLSACGLIGGLAAYMLLLLLAPQDTPAAYADMRVSIAAISDYILLPSLGIALVSGLLSMVVHQPYLNKRWAWFKAATGILMFKGVLTIVGAKADYAAGVAQQVASGEVAAEVLETALAYEWDALWTIMAVSVVNVVLGVWRPRLERRTQGRKPGKVRYSNTPSLMTGQAAPAKDAANTGQAPDKAAAE